MSSTDGSEDGGGRIPPLGAEEARVRSDEVGVPHYMTSLNVFRVLLQSPGVARACNELLSELLLHGALDVRLRELIIMRLGWTTGSVYEWTQHWRVATDLGVSAEDLLGVRTWERYPGFGATERAVLAATDETVRDGAVSAATWQDLCDHVAADPAVLVELLAVIGCWRMVASILRSAQVPLEEGAAPWPPDGLAPRG
ncbi:MAG: carboxymuconolactone decarboxylase family protein [Actinomycetota bacterium]|nr:carboxymuconolactone decarboxylase family protein [Actinomycetota bacterium]